MDATLNASCQNVFQISFQYGKAECLGSFEIAEGKKMAPTATSDVRAVDSWWELGSPSLTHVLILLNRCTLNIKIWPVCKIFVINGLDREDAISLSKTLLYICWWLVRATRSLPDDLTLYLRRCPSRLATFLISTSAFHIEHADGAPSRFDRCYFPLLWLQDGRWRFQRFLSVLPIPYWRSYMLRVPSAQWTSSLTIERASRQLVAAAIYL